MGGDQEVDGLGLDQRLRRLVKPHVHLEEEEVDASIYQKFAHLVVNGGGGGGDSMLRAQRPHAVEGITGSGFDGKERENHPKSNVSINTQCFNQKAYASHHITSHCHYCSAT